MFSPKSAWAASISIAAMISGLAVEAAAQTANRMEGRVVDHNGLPIANAEVTARYQSNPGGTSIQRTGQSRTDGYYSVDVSQPVGTWSGHAYTNYQGWWLPLTADNDALFAGNQGAIRNFTLRFLEQTPGNEYGVGGMVLVDRAFGADLDLGAVTLTLQPVKGGSTVTRRLRATGSGYVATGLAPGPYKITASLNGAPLQLGSNVAGEKAASSYTADFETVSSGIYQIHVYASPSSGGASPPPPGSTPPPPGSTPPPPGSTPPPPGSTPPPPGSTPAPPPASIGGYMIAKDAAQNVGKWYIRTAGVHYVAEANRQTPDRVDVAFIAKNNSPLVQAADKSFRISLNGATAYAPYEVRYDVQSASSSGSALDPFISSRVATASPSVKNGEEVIVYASFRVGASDQPKVKSVAITAVEQPASPILGKAKDAGTATIVLPATTKPVVTPPPAPPPPQPAPPAPPQPAPPPASVPAGPMAVSGTAQSLGRWSVRAKEVYYKSATGVTVDIVAKNTSLLTQTPSSALKFTLQGRGKTPSRHVTFAPTHPVAPTGEVVITAWFDLPQAEQEAVTGIVVTAVEQPRQGLTPRQPETSATLPLPSRPKAAPPVQKQQPAPAPMPTPVPDVPVEEIDGNDGFESTAYIDVRVDRVVRSRNGVEVNISLRNNVGGRKGAQHDTQRYILLGSNGVEYRTDGNFYGTTIDEHPGTTIFLEDGDIGQLTYFFPNVPASVKPQSLILKENGQETTRISLPQ